MSNKIIDSLISGSLAAKGKISFDNTQASYFLSYAGGAVGAYATSPKLSFYNYTQYETLPNGDIVQSVRPPRTFFLDKSLNDFFNSVISNNSKIAQALSPQQLAAATALDPTFVTGVYFYNPKAQVQLETIDMAKWALQPVQKTGWAAAMVYYNTLNNKTQAAADQAVLVTAMGAYITSQIEAQQKAGNQQWSANGMLSLEIKQNLITQAVLLQQYTALTQEISGFGLPNNPTLNDIISQSLNGTSYALARVVDLSISPFLYLWPRGANMPAVAPAVAPTT